MDFKHFNLDNELIKKKSNIYYNQLLNTDKFIDSCVYHHSIISKELLSELKDKFIFGTIPTKNTINYNCDLSKYPSAWIIFKVVDGWCYGLQLKSRITLPIFSNGNISVTLEKINRQEKLNQIEIIYDFDEVNKFININNFNYYNSGII